MHDLSYFLSPDTLATSCKLLSQVLKSSQWNRNSKETLQSEIQQLGRVVSRKSETLYTCLARDLGFTSGTNFKVHVLLEITRNRHFYDVSIVHTLCCNVVVIADQ